MVSLATTQRNTTSLWVRVFTQSVIGKSNHSSHRQTVHFMIDQILTKLHLICWWSRRKCTMWVYGHAWTKRTHNSSLRNVLAGSLDSESPILVSNPHSMFRLLFVTFTKRAEKDTAPDENIKAIEIPRNFSNIWQKFPQYDETNTLMISNFYNLEQEFRRNDLVLPLFHPKHG